MKRSNTALVTGGLGFIGSHLVERLLRDGVAVTVLDDHSTGRQANLEAVGRDEHPSVVRANVTDARTIRPHFEGIDQVFHLAARADIVPSIQRPEDYTRVNVTGTFNVLEAARAAGVRRFVYMASSSCYGIPETLPTPEQEPIRPQYPYALMKVLGEQFVMHWGQVYGMSVVSLRPFNVYGPRARTTGAYGAVMGVFLAQKLAGRPLTIVGDGAQTRDFVYVTDVVDAIVRAARSDVRNEALNIGSGAPHSVIALADLIGGERVSVPKRPGEPDCTWADISKVQRLLDWKPLVPFEEGVRRVLERISDWSEAPVWTPASIASATEDWFRYLAPAVEGGRE